MGMLIDIFSSWSILLYVCLSKLLPVFTFLIISMTKSEVDKRYFGLTIKQISDHVIFLFLSYFFIFYFHPKTLKF